jgi:pyruvate/2-oxoglutarate dehydrogenase complex dihydrolipoamide acyltransferase (E2) component
MQFEVILPSLGDEDDAVTGGSISYWLVEEGDRVREGDELVELTTDKAAFVVPSPRSGILVEKYLTEGDDVSVGDALCLLEV